MSTKSKWFKCTFKQKQGFNHDTSTALVLAIDELQVMNFIRDFCGDTFVESEVQHYCAVDVMTADFLTNHHGKDSNIDYIMTCP